MKNLLKAIMLFCLLAIVSSTVTAGVYNGKEKQKMETQESSSSLLPGSNAGSGFLSGGNADGNTGLEGAGEDTFSLYGDPALKAPPGGGGESISGITSISDGVVFMLLLVGGYVIFLSRRILREKRVKVNPETRENYN